MQPFVVFHFICVSGNIMFCVNVCSCANFFQNSPVTSDLKMKEKKTTVQKNYTKTPNISV